jgi:signal peptidase
MKKFYNAISWGFVILSGLLVAFFVVPFLPMQNNYKVVIVRSGSMEPAIHTGSIVTYRPAQTYRKNDVIAFENPSAGDKILTLHRVIEVQEKDGQPIYITRGDANQVNDVQPTESSRIKGKMLFTVPFVGYFISWLQTTNGKVILIGIPLLLLIYHEVHSYMHRKQVSKGKSKEQPVVSTVEAAKTE